MKKLISMILLLCFCLCLAGCSQEQTVEAKNWVSMGSLLFVPPTDWANGNNSRDHQTYSVSTEGSDQPAVSVAIDSYKFMYQNKEDLGEQMVRGILPQFQNKNYQPGENTQVAGKDALTYTGNGMAEQSLQAILFETTDSVVSVTVDYRDDSQREAYQEDVDGFLESIQIPEQPETQHMVSARIKNVSYSFPSQWEQMPPTVADGVTEHIYYVGSYPSKITIQSIPDGNPLLDTLPTQEQIEAATEDNPPDSPYQFWKVDTLAGYKSLHFGRVISDDLIEEQYLLDTPNGTLRLVIQSYVDCTKETKEQIQSFFNTFQVDPKEAI